LNWAARFVTAVAVHYPLSVLKTAVANALEQFVSVWPAEAWIDASPSITKGGNASVPVVSAVPWFG
jgi:hypothetical protein